jgi:hypothetical protein
MMWYIGVCGQLGGTPDCQPLTYTTPVETMEAYYDELKAGPWVALAWWVFGSWSSTCHGGLEYYDRALRHYTPEHPEGVPYSDEMLNYWRDEYIRVKMKMFNDVVYNQFAHLNRPQTEKRKSDIGLQTSKLIVPLPKSEYHSSSFPRKRESRRSAKLATLLTTEADSEAGDIETEAVANTSRLSEKPTMEALTTTRRDFLKLTAPGSVTFEKRSHSGE